MASLLPDRRTWSGAPAGVLVVFALLLSLPAGVTAASEAGEAATAVVSRLSDHEVRERLIAEIARGQEPVPAGAGEFNPAFTMIRLQHDVGRLSAELEALFAAAGELPGILPEAWRRFTADRAQGGLAGFAIALLASMGVGAIAALVVSARLGREFVPLPEGAATLRFRSKIAHLGARFGARVVYLTVFSLVAVTVFILFFDDQPRDRIAFFFYLAATAIFWLAVAASHLFHAPRSSALRIPLYTDDEARSLHRTALLSVGFGAFAFFTCALIGTLGILGPVHDLFLMTVGIGTTALLMVTVISGRRAITRDVTSDAPVRSARAIFARIWPWCFALALPVLMAGLIVRELLHDFAPYGAALFTVALMAVVPGLDAQAWRAGQAGREAHDGVGAAAARVLRIVLFLVVLVSLCVAWQVNPFAGDGGLQAKVAGAALQVTLTLLVAYVTWQFLRIVIDQKIAEEDAAMAAQGVDQGESEIGGTGLSRMRTLLPLLRRTLQVSLLVITLMIVLSSLGVEIAPLLAGAGVVGLAVGFGSQTLVRDIVSGAFFLLDDAFRIGEYIDVGVKGSVEKMSARSIRLRHHRGAIHTVPFGEIKTLTNYSRDWAIMKLHFRVPFDTDVDKVRKLLKATGQELLQNEDIKDDFIAPFKSQGATQADDYGFIITTKFTARPGRQFVIRRYAFAAVQKAFAEHGIVFATPRVDVSVEETSPPRDMAARDGGASGRSSVVAGAAAERVLGSPASAG